MFDFNLEFRIWSKKDKNYITEYENNNLFISLDGDVKVNEDGEMFTVFNNFIIEMFTGLKDKHDKKIYDGSIVYYDYQPHEKDSWNLSYYAVIEWKSTGFHISPYNPKNKGGYCSWLVSLPSAYKEVSHYAFTVVGDIHNGITNDINKDKSGEKDE